MKLSKKKKKKHSKSPIFFGVNRKSIFQRSPKVMIIKPKLSTGANAEISFAGGHNILDFSVLTICFINVGIQIHPAGRHESFQIYNESNAFAYFLILPEWFSSRESFFLTY